VFCPVCKAEYRFGITVCSDCHVALVPNLTAAPGEAGDDPFCAFWRGDDPRAHAELCALLDEAGIPYKTVRREDHHFNITQQNALEIGVPFSLYEKAETAVNAAFGTDDETGADAVPILPPPALPESRGAPRSRDDWDPENWFPQDATVEVWSGDQSEMADMLGASLRENKIHVRWEQAVGKDALFVLPEDESRAREILREVLEASPPE